MLVDVEIGLAPNCNRDYWERELTQEQRDRLTPARIAQGLYLCSGWNPKILLRVTGDFRIEGLPDDVPCYGVCDTPEQVVERFRLDTLPGQFVVTFVCLRRSTQPKRDGWRWHKWGPYIGTQRPQCEYLADEPKIEKVFTFQIYNPANA